MIASQRPGINGWAPEYLEAQFQAWKLDIASVSPEWDFFFRGFELAATTPSNGTGFNGFSRAALPAPAADEAYVQKYARVTSLIYHYRDIGHLMADVDPLGVPRPKPELLELDAFHLSTEDLAEEFSTPIFGLEGRKTPLSEIIAIMEETYCGHLAAEYMHIQDTNKRRWLQRELESRRSKPNYSKAQKLSILRKLHKAEIFEGFLQTRYLGQKRFSLEGAETLIPLLHCCLNHAAEMGVEEVVIGMAHRGRLNVLANIVGKGYDDIFAEFEDNYAELTDGGGDVKYHKGYSANVYSDTGNEIYLTLAANPSHLEAVDPVVLGRTRAKQRQRGDKARKRVVPILMHGDAAFCGQGIVAEVLQLKNLPGYTTGGTIHIIVNNQIGFTTDPASARSSTYSTDVAKTVQAPIFHVNGDDPEVCGLAMELAVAYRQEFGEDVVVDMWCYRKHGHNEGDEPAFTQPAMVRRIQAKQSPCTIYSHQLQQEGVITEAEEKDLQDALMAVLDDAQAMAKITPVRPNQKGYLRNWFGFGATYSFDPVVTAVPKDKLISYAQKLSVIPDGFTPHRKIATLYKNRLKAVEEGKGLDWGNVEALCFASLLDEGIPVRLSGQDSRRGTFSHRHSVLIDSETCEPYKPLDHLREGQPTFCVYDSPLAEASVLGFEYGYSLGDPNMLIMWEAQFGDFANGAQLIIDQFLTCAEIKWDRSSGLVLLLPHGYEGQGPEHSSARMERFLQLCAMDNIQVANLTTPAQFFHMMRRQMKRTFRKPLVIMSPKSLLRSPLAVSTLEDLTDGHFQELIDDATANPKRVKRIMFCSGKVYYDLIARREKVADDTTAIVRVEQIYPLHKDLMHKILDRYPMATEHYWVQEEPKNMGAWNHMAHNIVEHFGLWPKYIGRAPSPSPAVGSHAAHERELEVLLSTAFPNGNGDAK